MRGVQEMNHRVVGASLRVVLLRIPDVGQHQMSVEEQREIPLLLRADLSFARRFRDRNQRRNVQNRGDARIFFADTNPVGMKTMLKSSNLMEERTLIDTRTRWIVLFVRHVGDRAELRGVIERSRTTTSNFIDRLNRHQRFDTEERREKKDYRRISRSQPTFLKTGGEMCHRWMTDRGRRFYSNVSFRLVRVDVSNLRIELLPVGPSGGKKSRSVAVVAPISQLGLIVNLWSISEGAAENLGGVSIEGDIAKRDETREERVRIDRLDDLLTLMKNQIDVIHFTLTHRGNHRFLKEIRRQMSNDRRFMSETSGE